MRRFFEAACGGRVAVRKWQPSTVFGGEKKLDTNRGLTSARLSIN